jgi:peptide/nickel transport system substrate-binding protein
MSERDSPHLLTRRGVLALGAQSALAVGGASLLAACGSGTASSSGTTAGAVVSSGGGTPVSGGTLTVGLISGGAAETINPGLMTVNGDFARGYQVYERLFIEAVENPGSAVLKTALVPTLALSAERNSDATTWTVQLRDHVTWHDGRPFTADDAVWTISKLWQNPGHYQNPFVAGIIDFGSVRKRGPLTVEIPLLVPVADFPALFTTDYAQMAQDGVSFKALGINPVGTGPFKFASFTPGVRASFVANRDYWQEGKPYVDRLELLSSFTDEDARTDALLSGVVDVLPIYSFANAKAQQSSGRVKILSGTSACAFYIYMRVDKPPFNDVRVRQAMRLLVDREAMIRDAFDGYGSVANDLVGIGARYFDSSLTRSQDLEQAKALLKAAGREGMTVTLPTAAASAGYIEMATVFAYQAAAAGVTVNVKEVPPTIYFTSAGGWLTNPMGQDNTTTYVSLSLPYRENFIPNASADETKWGDVPAHRAANQLLIQATAETDPVKAQDLWNEVQRIQFDQGGQIVPVAPNEVDAVSNQVRGLEAAGTAYPLNDFAFKDAWLAGS